MIRLAGVLAIVLTAAAQDPAGFKIPRDGFDLYYRTYGTGAPVAILAGGPGFDCDYMEPVARELAKTRRAVLIELRGTGRSIPPAINRETINPAEYLGDLEAVRTHLGVERWSLLGHSAGAVLALRYAAAHPDRVVSLVLANSGPIRDASDSATIDNILLHLTPVDREALFKQGLAFDARTFKLALPGYFYDRQKALAFAETFRSESFHPEIRQLLIGQMRPGGDLRPLLKSFGRPVLVIAGRQDPLDPAVQYEIHLAMRNSRLVLLKRCGHFAWLEQPDEFYREVGDFLAAETSPSAEAQP